MKTLNFRPEQGSDVSDRLECREEKNEKNSYYTVQRDCAGDYCGGIIRKPDLKERSSV